jgi:hypothetical protein
MEPQVQDSMSLIITTAAFSAVLTLVMVATILLICSWIARRIKEARPPKKVVQIQPDDPTTKFSTFLSKHTSLADSDGELARKFRPISAHFTQD